MRLGTYLKNLRTARDWTQPDAAEKIGVEQSYLSKLENGKATPSETILDDLVRAYQIDLDKMVRILSPDELTQLSFYAPIAERRAALIKTQTITLRTSLLMSLFLVAFGAALVATGVNQTFSKNVFVYESKGVIPKGKTALIYEQNYTVLRAAATQQLLLERKALENAKNNSAEKIRFVVDNEAINTRIDNLGAEIQMTINPAFLVFDERQPITFNRNVDGGTRQYQYNSEITRGDGFNNWSINIGVFFLALGFVGFYVGRVWR